MSDEFLGVVILICALVGFVEIAMRAINLIRWMIWGLCNSETKKRISGALKVLRHGVH